MYDRNEFDQRIAEHQEHVAQIERHGWKRGDSPHGQHARQIAATVLRIVAARLDPTAVLSPPIMAPPDPRSP